MSSSLARRAAALGCLLLSFPATIGQPLRSDPKATAIGWLEAHSNTVIGWADKIWELAELPFEEVQTASLLTEELRKAGFDVQKGVAGMPTAFVARFGAGEPVIGILAEYDALPGLSQKRGVLVREPLVPGKPGHGCGHHLIAAANVAAAIAVKNAMARHHVQGTLKVFGTPAEEEYIPKVYMVREGLFKDVDAGILWHPGYDFCVPMEGGEYRALDSVVFTFSRPEPSGSSLERAVELFEERLRQLEQEVGKVRAGPASRLGSGMPSVAPPELVLRYFFMGPDRQSVDGFRRRALQLAQDTARSQGIHVTADHLIGIYQTLRNKVLARLVRENLEPFLPLRYTPEETQLARRMQELLLPQAPAVVFYDELHNKHDAPRGPDDDGDVSWNIPFVSFHAAVQPAGVPNHTWANTAVFATSIAHKGMMVASKAVAATAIDLLVRPDLLEEARREFELSRQGAVYSPYLQPGRSPMALYDVIKRFYR
ncbi:MAG: hypothetical protein HY652_08025 [Acidobacteria bacterium]|nr:hypothetical protein [Acidobacteriota bacterium]